MLLFIMAPLTVWITYQENIDEEKSRIIYQSLREYESEEVQNELLELDLVSEEVWDSLAIESRFEEIKKFTEYQCAKLGVENVDIFAVKELTDGTLAYYADSEDAIYFNVIYLNECSLREALRVAAHETYHRYEEALIQSLEVLEEAEVGYESLNYYSDLIELKNAKNSYYMDSLSYDTYEKNLLEVRADEYAEKEIAELEEMNYLTASE